MKDIEVYVENLRYYNQGRDIGRWITLGVDEKELKRTLEEELKITQDYPDIVIFDSHSDFEISEYGDIYHLNQLAYQLKQLPEQNYQKVLEFCQARDIVTPLEMSNVCQQLEEVPYEHFPDWIENNIDDPEEKLGYALFESSELAPIMKAMHMEDYFDYKSYGYDESINSYNICEHGFVDKKIPLDVEKFSYEEIQEQIKNQENGIDSGKELNFSERYEEQNTWEYKENTWSEGNVYKQETYTMPGQETMVEEELEITIED